MFHVTSGLLVCFKVHEAKNSPDLYNRPLFVGLIDLDKGGVLNEQRDAIHGFAQRATHAHHGPTDKLIPDVKRRIWRQPTVYAGIAPFRRGMCVRKDKDAYPCGCTAV